MAKYLDMAGLQHLWNQIKSKLDGKVDKITGKGLSTNDYTTTEKNKLAGIETGANKYVHANSGVSAGTYKSVTVNTQGHITAGTNPTTLSGYGITDAATKSHTHGNNDITSLDASKLTGTIDLARIPAGALERCVVVADDTARLALKTSTVQKGDTVKVTSTGKMYFVVDDTKLSSEAGYEVYTAGSATSVPWSGVTGKPSTFTPTSHTHVKSQITDFPSSLKNPASLTIQINGASQGTYDGSVAKTVNITTSTIGIDAITNTEIDAIVTS